MDVLVAVVDDLWQFAIKTMFGYRQTTDLDKEREYQPQLGLSPQTHGVPTAGQAELFGSSSRLMPDVGDFRVGEQYFIGELDTFLYSDPVVAFDTATQKLHYGESVILKKIGGRWAEVESGHGNGWVIKDVLALRREDIFPTFTEGVVYDAHNHETIKLRGFIDDDFGGAMANLPLQSAEYVTFKLKMLKATIAWAVDSPRVPGSWQMRLRGVKGVYMNVLPKTHAVMEYSNEEEGHLAFVEAVFPDRSIKISEVGGVEVGDYREIIMTQEEYRELKPVFIAVS